MDAEVRDALNLVLSLKSSPGPLMVSAAAIVKARKIIVAYYDKVLAEIDDTLKSTGAILGKKTRENG